MIAAGFLFGNKEINNGKENAEAFQAPLKERADYRSKLAEGDEQATGDQGSSGAKNGRGVLSKPLRFRDRKSVV